jgi:hypothetical protein
MMLPDSNDYLARIAAELAATRELLRQMTEHDAARTARRELKRADQAVLAERLARDRAEHVDRMAKMDETLVEVKDVQKDIRAILQMMTQRFAGE